MGKACPIPCTRTDEAGSGTGTGSGTQLTRMDEDTILQQRLFGNDRRVPLECEVDYNRVLAHRLGRILFPRTEITIGYWRIGWEGSCFRELILRQAFDEDLAAACLNSIDMCSSDLEEDGDDQFDFDESEDKDE